MSKILDFVEQNAINQEVIESETMLKIPFEKMEAFIKAAPKEKFKQGVPMLMYEGYFLIPLDF